MMLLTHSTDASSVALARTLNKHNFNYLVLADCSPDQVSADGLRYQQQLMHDALPNWIDEHQIELEFMFLLSADDDTLFQMMWDKGVRYQLPFIFRATNSRTDWITQQSKHPFFWAGLAWTEPDRANPAEAPDFQQLVPNQPTVAPSSEDYVAVYPAAVAKVGYYLVHHRTDAGIYALNNARTYRTNE